MQDPQAGSCRGCTSSTGSSATFYQSRDFSGVRRTQRHPCVLGSSAWVCRASGTVTSPGTQGANPAPSLKPSMSQHSFLPLAKRARHLGVSVSSPAAGPHSHTMHTGRGAGRGAGSTPVQGTRCAPTLASPQLLAWRHVFGNLCQKGTSCK